MAKPKPFLTKSEKSSIKKFRSVAGDYKATVSGLAELSRNLENLSKGMRTKQITKAVSASAKAAVKLIKGEIPSRYKGARQSIGWRRPKRKHNAGQITAKVGVGVGKATEAKAKRITKTHEKHKVGGKKGVGISSANAHWFFLGTDHRWTGTKRVRSGRQTVGRVDTGGLKKYTGKMPKKIKSVSSMLASYKTMHLRIIKTYASAGLRMFVRNVSSNWKSAVKAADKAGKIKKF